MASFDGSDSTTTEERPLGATRDLPEGAPIARAPIDFGSPGGRRSLAHGSEEQPHSPTVIAPARPLRVVDGQADTYEPEEQSSTLSLNPTTAMTIGDFAAAMAGPVAAAVYARSVAVFIGAALLVLLLRAQARRSALSESEIGTLSPFAAGLGALVMAVAVEPHLTVAEAALTGGVALLAGAGAAIVMRAIVERFINVRVAVLGEAAVAHDLAYQLSVAGVRRFTVLGYVTRTSERDNLRDLEHISFKVRRLGLLNDLSHIVARNDIDLLVMCDSEDRMKVFERAAVCSERFRTQLITLGAFEESIFRRVPLEQLNAAWFQHIMHPRFRRVPLAVTRSIDVVFGVLAAIITAPVWGATALFMRAAFGKPVIVERRRVGERGRTIMLWRFRVARRQVTGEPPVESAPAVGFGRFLRATGIEQLPVLYNLIRGDVSLVGPRAITPDQLQELDGELPFYSRRNLLRPGLTGWAQLHTEPHRQRTAADPDAEYSKDLFYLKHQSLMLYAYVLLASARLPFTRSAGEPEAEQAATTSN